ncbi:Phosphatidylglycerophosphate synthase [Sphingobium faniae]|nr:Phosphatidylglycerophosphate synthase [Sphingobium faniae]
MSGTIALRLLGNNDTPIWGMTNAERLRRLARAEGLSEDASSSDARLYANLDYVFDPSWLRHVLATPGMVVMDGEVLVLAHLTGDIAPDNLERHRSELTFIDYRNNPQIYNRQLRKLDCPFIQRLTPATRREIERKSYFGAYKGVTDLLTKYLWPELALWLTRLAASLGMTPNMVTGIGAALCLLATYLFSQGLYGSGMLAGFAFMVLDTVDGKLARCTITSSKWGNVFDHGVDLVHPPFWWYFWGVGLGAWGLALSSQAFALVMATVILGYVLQRLIEGMFIKDFGMDIHVWRPFDSRFRLITARRNPNMAILFVALLSGRPDIGLIAVAWWTAISLLVHAVRLAQAYGAKRSGQPIVSWMEAQA